MARGRPFPQKFEQSRGVPTFGEVFEGSVDDVSDDQKYEWGVLDFPLFFTVRDVFNGAKYVNPRRLVTFMDNRDRLLTVADDDWQRLAMTFTFAAPEHPAQSRPEEAPDVLPSPPVGIPGFFARPSSATHHNVVRPNP